MKNIVLNIKKIIFNSKCEICKRQLNDKENYICYNCYSELKYNSSLKKNKKFYYFWDYDGYFKKLIKAYKFKNKKGISKIYMELLEKKIIYLLKKEKIDYIIPVPINKKRKIKRGFNQVEEILNKMEINYIKIKRIKNTKPMYKLLNEQKRMKNINKSFRLNKKYNFNNKTILIFDDIITTGTTINEIKKEININEMPKKVIVLAMASTKTSKNIRGKYEF